MMRITKRSRRRTIRRGLQRARTACVAAVAGATRRGSAGRRSATGAARGSALRPGLARLPSSGGQVKQASDRRAGNDATFLWEDTL